MYTNINTYSITDLRHKTTQILAGLASNGFAYVVRNSKTEAAIVDLGYLQALQIAYEDYSDILEFDRTINLKRISLSKHQKLRSLRK